MGRKKAHVRCRRLEGAKGQEQEQEGRRGRKGKKGGQEGPGARARRQDKQRQKQKDNQLLVASESDARQYRLSPGGPFRPSLPCCSSVAKALFSSLGS